MSGQTSASPSIDEPRPKSSAQPELALQNSADSARPPNTLGASSGMLSDIGRSRLLPALVEAPAPRRATRAFPVGILLYLASLGIIAIATIGVFFGLGFFLLARPTEAMIANDAGAKQDSTVNRRRQQIMVTTSPMSGDVASVPIQPEVLRSAATAALPVAPLVPSSSPPSRTGNAATGPVQDQTVGEASLGASAPVPTPAEAAHLSAGQITELLTRGDIFLHAGDVVSARLFYERAADAGDRQAAMRMGATFDPAFLDRVGLHTRGDTATALSWYRHALDLGAPKTDRQTQSLQTK